MMYCRTSSACLAVMYESMCRYTMQPVKSAVTLRLLTVVLMARADGTRCTGALGPGVGTCILN